MKNIFKFYNTPIMHRVASSSLWSTLKLWILVFLAFNSIMPYFLWGRGIVVCVFIILLFVFQCMQYLYGGKDSIPRFSNSILLIILSWLLFYTYRYILRPSSLGNLILSVPTTFYPVLTLILCTNNEKKRFLSSFTTFMAFILGVSLLEYFLVITGVLNITPKKIFFPGNSFYEYFENYGLFIVVNDLRNFLIPRFQSVFTEPGQLGMMCTLMLYANEYNLKDKRVIIILVATIVTMSLASYVLLVVGIFFYIYSKSNKKLLMAVCLGFLAFMLGIAAVTYYKVNPNSYFSTAILSRLMPDKDRGIKGNNRNTAEFKRLYSQQMEKLNSESLFGYGVNALKEKLTSGNASAAVFIFQFGIIGLILLILFYFSICFDHYSDVVLGMFALFTVSFLQRPYATWFSQIALMMTAAIEFKEIYSKKATILNKYLLSIDKEFS